MGYPSEKVGEKKDYVIEIGVDAVQFENYTTEKNLPKLVESDMPISI